MKYTLAQVRKAATALVVGFGGALGASMLDGKITLPEVVVAAGTGLVAGVATFKIENAK